MATIYEVKVVSDWINYTEEQLQKILQDAITKIEKEKHNEIRITVISRS